MLNKKRPVTIVIFGATGNLAINKIFPALMSLIHQGLLPKGSRIVGVSRREWNDTSFRSFLRESLGDKKELEHFFHSEVEFDEGRGYYDLRDRLEELDKKHGRSEKLFYLSLAPKYYERVVRDMRKVKLFKSSSKLLVEKPFGSDEKSARKLNTFLMSFLKHEQVYRVDHYLGKETVRAIMKIHETAQWLSTLLTRETVESISVGLFEEKGIEKRGASYDSVGAFRDVGQNHILEVLAVLCMTPPKTSKSTLWHQARVNVIESLLLPTKTCEFSRRGQYDGYIKEWAIPDKSKTETAFEVSTSFTKGKLKGVPIILLAGKKMLSSEAFVKVKMLEFTNGLKNITFFIQPNPRIELVYHDKVESTELSERDAYENVFLDAVEGERRHFVGGKEVIAAWKYADTIVNCWNKVPLEIYSKNKPFII